MSLANQTTMVRPLQSKLKERTATSITTEQSQKLIQTMLTMSFGCLAFLRGLFPDDNFVDQRFVPEKIDKNYNKSKAPSNNSLRIKTLRRGCSSEVDVLLDWLEKAVFKSIKLKYLKALSLGIFLDENHPTDLLENYIFEFEYDKNDNVHMKLNDENEPISLLNSRKMVQQLMRRFIIITQSLEPLPQKKFLTMRLMFNDDCDPEYQPYLFKDATFEESATLKLPKSMDMESFKVGDIKNPCHTVSVKVVSVPESSLEEIAKGNYVKIDPFDLLDCNKNIQDHGLPSQPLNEDTNQSKSLCSQTTCNLGGLLKSSQSLADSNATFQPTQAVMTHAATDLECECGLPAPVSSTTIRTCRRCRKSLHGFCYGNPHSTLVPHCLTCVVGDNANLSSLPNFQDLMILRRCYRYMMRSRGCPASIAILRNTLFRPDIANNSGLIEKTNFAISVLFLDNILVINDEHLLKNGKGPNKRYNGSLLIDIEGNIPIPGGELIKGHTYDISLVYPTKSGHSCYMDTFCESHEQFQRWLKDVESLRDKITPNSRSLPSSINIGSLDINDNDTLDPIPAIRKTKRKNFELNDYLRDGDSNTVMKDTLASDDDSQFDPRAQNKIRKISVSKKTLRSVW